MQANVSELSLIKGWVSFVVVIVNPGLGIRGCSNRNDQHLAGNMLPFYIHEPDTVCRYPVRC